MAAISNGLKQPVTDRALIGNGFTSPLTIGLTFVMGSFNTRYKEFFNRRLRSPLPEVHIVHRSCGGQPLVVLARL
jgi:hypothetical protein